MSKKDIKRLLLLNIPYVILGLVATNIGEAWRLAEGQISLQSSSAFLLPSLLLFLIRCQVFIRQIYLSA